MCRYFGPSDAAVNVPITDGVTVSDAEWSCVFNMYL